MGVLTRLREAVRGFRHPKDPAFCDHPPHETTALDGGLGYQCEECGVIADDCPIPSDRSV